MHFYTVNASKQWYKKKKNLGDYQFQIPILMLMF